MDLKFKKDLEKLVGKFPHPKILFALTTAIILGAILYMVILFFLSK